MKSDEKALFEMKNDEKALSDEELTKKWQKKHQGLPLNPNGAHLCNSRFFET